ADDLSSTARVRRETSSRSVVKLTGNICVSELRKINMTLVRRGAVISLLALGLLEPRQPAPAATGDDPVEQLDAFITKTLKEYQVPGAAIAVVQNGKAVLLKGYGVRDATKQGAVDENTIFQLASVTKTLTGAAAATVVDEGKLDWDKPIFNYLPEFVGYDPYMTRWLTERDLLAQRTGWPAFSGDQLDSFGYDRAEILRRLRFFKPRYSLRDVAQYSNPGFFVAGEVAARASKQSWNDLVEKRLFAPLEMSRSGTVIKALQDSNATAAHALVDEKPVVVEPSNLDITGAASSGTSTAADMSKLMLMFLNKGTYKGKQVLKPETVEEIFKRSMASEIDFTDLPPISDKTGFYYGLGVGSYDYAGHQIIEKGGALAGVRTTLVLVPDKNAGIVVLANLNLTAFPEAVRAYFLNQVLGIDPETDQKQIFDINQKLKKLMAPPPAPKNPGKFNGTLQSLVGVYENDYYGRCEILLDGDALKVQCGSAKYPATLKHWNNGAFMMQFPGATQTPSVTTFMIGEDGTADGFETEALGTFTRVREKK
ncbi:MAG TPA: serine hydrolase, partial [Candidatus Acidoferrum sp.]|nr:serine hydrolase [Candidatus Acidoferrum sp.]